MKKVLCLIMTAVLLISACGCGAKEPCRHEFEASVNGNTVTLKCKLCGETASADVELPKETVEVEKVVEKTVEKIVEKPVTKTVTKVVEKEVPVYVTDEDSMQAEDYEKLSYYKENYEKIDYLKKYISNHFYKDVDEKAMMEAAYKAMVDSLGDQYSVYTPAPETEEYSNALAKAYSGIGIMIVADEDNNAVISDTTHGSPAESAGLKAGDIIVSADGVSLLGKGIDEAAAVIRGEVGTIVNVIILRDGERLSFNVARRQISQSTVDYGMFIDGTGYISISGFNALTAYEMSLALGTLEYYETEKCVIDIRNNGGGMVDAALYVADMLMNEGVMAYVQDHDGNKEYYRTYPERTSMEYVVLCNENSASATEMLLAGIQDNNEGKIIGTKTYGKGLVQIFQTLLDGSSLSLTEYQYFSPNGKEIQKNGITPDYEADYTDECYDENGNLLYDPWIVKAFEVLYPDLY